MTISLEQRVATLEAEVGALVQASHTGFRRIGQADIAKMMVGDERAEQVGRMQARIAEMEEAYRAESIKAHDAEVQLEVLRNRAAEWHDELRVKHTEAHHLKIERDALRAERDSLRENEAQETAAILALRERWGVPPDVTFAAGVDALLARAYEVARREDLWVLGRDKDPFGLADALDRTCKALKDSEARWQHLLAKQNELRQDWGIRADETLNGGISSVFVERSQAQFQDLKAEIAALSARVNKADESYIGDGLRDMGVAASAFMRWVTGGAPPTEAELPKDVSDLAACRRAFVSLPEHLVTDAMQAWLEENVDRVVIGIKRSEQEGQ